MSIYTFALQLKKKIKCSEWEYSQLHLVGKLNPTSYFLAADLSVQRTESCLVTVKVRGMKKCIPPMKAVK